MSNQTKVSLVTLSNIEKQLLMDKVIQNVYRTRVRSNNPNFGDSMLENAERIRLHPDGEKSKWINIFSPSIPYIKGMSNLGDYVETKPTTKEIIPGLVDKRGKQLFIGSIVNVYYQADGVTSQVIARSTKDGIYFEDNRYLSKKHVARLLRYRS